MSIAYSINRYTGDGSTTEFAVSFVLDYLRKSHVFCYVDGEVDGAGDVVPRTLTWITDFLVDIGTAPALDVGISIRRITPKTALMHDFADGAVLHELNIDESNLQNIMLNHEVLDGFGLESAAEAVASAAAASASATESAGYRDTTETWSIASAASAATAAASATSADDAVDEIKALYDVIGNYNDSLSDALLAIGTTPTILVIDKLITLTEDSEIPDTIILKKTRAGRFTGPYTITMTGSGMIGDMTNQWFSSSVTVIGTPEVDSPFPEIFGADSTGASSSTAAFLSTLTLFGRVQAMEGTYDIAGLTASGTSVTSPKLISGRGWGLTTLTGDGDLITTDGYFNLENLTIENDSTRGKLYQVTSGIAINESYFNNVKFGKSTYHMSSPSRLLVGWSWFNCRFKDASIVSRLFDSLWAVSETKSYVWGNLVGLEVHGGSTFNSYGSIYELNTDEAVKLISSAADHEIFDFKFSGTHFENNGDATTPHVLLQSDTVSEAIVSLVSFENARFIHSTDKTIPNILISTASGSAINRIGLDTIFSDGALINDAVNSLVRLKNIKYLANTYYDGSTEAKTAGPGLNQTETDQRIIQGAVGGNGVEQFTNTLKTSETHIITITTLATGTGTSGGHQQYAVQKKPDGVVQATLIFDNGSSYGCVIDVTTHSTGDYAVDNKAAMPGTFQPRIIIERK